MVNPNAMKRHSSLLDSSQPWGWEGKNMVRPGQMGQQGWDKSQIPLNSCLYHGPALRFVQKPLILTWRWICTGL